MQQQETDGEWIEGRRPTESHWLEIQYDVRNSPRILRRSYRKATELMLICAIKFKLFALASSLFPKNVLYKLKNVSASSIYIST